jgi:hypothetical protein
LAEAPATLDDVFLSWAQGFMSALNGTRLSGGLNSKQLSSMSAADQIEKMRAYYVAHPNEKYMAAVHDLFDSLPELPASGSAFALCSAKSRVATMAALYRGSRPSSGRKRCRPNAAIHGPDATGRKIKGSCPTYRMKLKMIGLRQIGRQVGDSSV